MKRSRLFSVIPMNSSLQLLLAGVLLPAFSNEVAGLSFQPPAGYTGAPPQMMTCASCHTGSGSGSLNLSFGEGELTYVPGQTYPIDVILNDPGQDRFGFSMTARLQSAPATPVGTWTAGLNSGVYDSGRHIGHRDAPFANGGHTFPVMWTAPSSDVGPIIFYAAGNAANGNFANGAGDNIYTRQLTIQPGMVAQSFWSDSPVTNGWRNTGEAYPDLAGIGWIQDETWPWYFTHAHQGGDAGEWIYVFAELGDRFGFWAYNYTGGYYFYGVASWGWYYSYETGEEGWYPYKL